MLPSLNLREGMAPERLQSDKDLPRITQTELKRTSDERRSKGTYTGEQYIENNIQNICNINYRNIVYMIIDYYQNYNRLLEST